MRKSLKAVPAAALAATAAFIEGVGSTGMKEFDQHICDLLKAWGIRDYTGCEVHAFIPYLWVVALGLGLAAYAPDIYAFARRVAGGEKAHVEPRQESILDCVADVRLADSQSLLGLFDSPQRDKLISLLIGERISSWARPMGLGHQDLVRLKGSDWEIHYMVKHDPTSHPSSIHQTFFRTKTRNESKYYDIYLNYEQIKLIWPSLQLERAYEKDAV